MDKVILEPNPNSPDTVQVWGVFALADAGSKQRNAYVPPAPGYLYFKLADNPYAARTEWKDLKTLAGSGRIVAFGNRFFSSMRLRKSNEPAKEPDPYDTNLGLQEIRQDTEYPPVRALVNYKD